MTVTEARRRIIIEVSAVLLALDEVGGCPESAFYLGLGMDIRRWENVKSVLQRCELATFKNNEVRLTEKGKLVAQQLENAAVGGDISQVEKSPE